MESTNQKDSQKRGLEHCCTMQQERMRTLSARKRTRLVCLRGRKQTFSEFSDDDAAIYCESDVALIRCAAGGFTAQKHFNRRKNEVWVVEPREIGRLLYRHEPCIRKRGSPLPTSSIRSIAVFCSMNCEYRHGYFRQVAIADIKFLYRRDAGVKARLLREPGCGCFAVLV